MSYRNTEELIQILKEKNLWAKKSMGQNFLVNPQIIEKITAAAEITKKDTIVEVGPGLGVLTEALIEKAGHVISIELDRTLAKMLKEQFAGAGNLLLVEGDALDSPLPHDKYKLVANIPYYISSPLLRRFLIPRSPDEKRPDLILLMIQLEVAEKICAKDGDHSVLSLQTQVFGKPEIVAKVSKSNFFPQPKVDSALLKITTYPEPLITNTDFFFKLLHTAFGQRRKTLMNSLQSLPPYKTRAELEKIFTAAGIDISRRPQTLSIIEWQKLINAWR